MSQAKFTHTSVTISDLANRFERGQINLEPGFQRQSVWTKTDRASLIESISLSYPLPAIFLHKRNDGGQVVYDVIDGKQRLESIYMFMGLGKFKREKFEARYCTRRLPDGEPEMDRLDWNAVKKAGLDYSLNAYNLPVVELGGDFGEVIEVFVRINSTGKKLTSAEKRHAKHYHSEFLKKAARLAEKYVSYFRSHGVLTPGSITRMKHVELVCELVATVAGGSLLDKKRALDDVLANKSVKGRHLDAAIAGTVKTLNLVRRLFPRIQETRFRNAADFYSLFFFVSELERRGCVLTEPTRNAEAEKVLILLSKGVDAVRESQRKAQGISADDEPFRDYLLTVQADTDSRASRERRAVILNSILAGIFESKDENRSFSAEQRRLIWHSSGDKTCSFEGCGIELDWTNFTIDHVKPHSKGGRTSEENAALMCKKHNSKKGAR